MNDLSVKNFFLIRLLLALPDKTLQENALMPSCHALVNKVLSLSMAVCITVLSPVSSQFPSFACIPSSIIKQKLQKEKEKPQKYKISEVFIKFFLNSSLARILSLRELRSSTSSFKTIFLYVPSFVDLLLRNLLF